MMRVVITLFMHKMAVNCSSICLKELLHTSVSMMFTFLHSMLEKHWLSLLDIKELRVTMIVGSPLTKYNLTLFMAAERNGIPIGPQLKKREKKEMIAVQAAEYARKEALRDDRDAFTVVIGSRASVLDGDDEVDANIKDITVDNFSVSARGKELLKNASVKISHGKRYGLIGPNGMGKSTLLKLLAWRKIPVPKNIDVLLVEQEVVGNDRSALQAVLSANEELVKLREEVAALQNSFSIAGEEDGDDAGEKLAELYEKLQILGSDAAEAKASKIL